MSAFRAALAVRLAVASSCRLLIDGATLPFCACQLSELTATRAWDEFEVTDLAIHQLVLVDFDIIIELVLASAVFGLEQRIPSGI